MDRTATVRMRLVTSQFESAAARAGQSVRGVGNEFTRASAKSTPGMQAMGRAAMIAGAAAAVGVGIAVRAYADFDQQMSHVQAATHETAANMDLMRDAALKAGARTVFTATESAQAIEQLAKAGVSTADILGGGLAGALDLAAAGSLDVGQAAEIAATAMTQFKLQGKDIPHIADLLAAGAGKAQGEVADMALAMEYAGVPAAELGVSIEQTAGTIALFAKNGIVGERAGTSLRSMIASLTSPSVKAKGVMEDLGISVFDAQGSFIGLDGVAGQLEQRLGSATDAEKSMALGVIFGNEALQAANVLTREGAEGVRKWTQEVDDQGYAATTAALKLDNLRGDWEQFTGSLETALIKSGSASDGLLRTTLQSATGVVNAYGALPGPIQAGATALIAIAGAATFAGGAFVVMAPKVAAARAQLALMPRTSAAASAAMRNLGKAGAVFAIWQVATIGLKALQDQITDTVPGVDSLTSSLLAMNASADLESLGGQFENIGDAIGRITDKAAIDEFGDRFVGIFGLQTNKMRQATDAIEGIDAALAGLVQSGNPEEASRIFDLVAQAAALQGRSLDDVRRVMPAYAEALAGVDNEQTLAGESGGDLAGSLLGVDAAASDAASAVEDYKGELDSLNGVNISAMQAQIELAESFDDTKDAVKGHGKATRDERKALLDLATQINETADAFTQQSGTVDAGNKVLADSRAGFVRLAHSMGMSIPKANELADAVIGIPPKKDSKVAVTGVPKAVGGATNVADAIYSIPGHRISHVSVSGAAAAVAQVEALNRALSGVRSGRHFSVNGAGSGFTSGSADGGRLPYGIGLAGGGRIPSWMGGPRQDNVLIAPGVFASGGEYVVNEPATRANLGLLELINSGRIKTFSAGGLYGGGAAGGGVATVRLHPEDAARLDRIAARQVVIENHMRIGERDIYIANANEARRVSR